LTPTILDLLLVAFNFLEKVFERSFFRFGDCFFGHCSRIEQGVVDSESLVEGFQTVGVARNITNFSDEPFAPSDELVGELGHFLGEILLLTRRHFGAVFVELLLETLKVPVETVFELLVFLAIFEGGDVAQLLDSVDGQGVELVDGLLDFGDVFLGSFGLREDVGKSDDQPAHGSAITHKLNLDLVEVVLSGFAPSRNFEFGKSTGDESLSLLAGAGEAAELVINTVLEECAFGVGELLDAINEFLGIVSGIAVENRRESSIEILLAVAEGKDVSTDNGSVNFGGIRICDGAQE
jgi:hypothetical protein